MATRTRLGMVVAAVGKALGLNAAAPAAEPLQSKSARKAARKSAVARTEQSKAAKRRR